MDFFFYFERLASVSVIKFNFLNIDSFICLYEWSGMIICL